MKRSLIVQVGLRAVLPALLLGSFLVFWRGHNLPGGGFIAGLVAGAAFALYGFYNGAESLLSLVRIRPLTYVALGLFLALISGLVGAFAAGAPFKGVWAHLPILGPIGTPLIFDFGVYLLVTGFVLVFIVGTLQEEK